jgi:transcriptional regulator of arginine metabolism
LFKLYVQQIDGNADLLLLKTVPGAAHIVAAAIDRLSLTEVVGTLAGDDTLMVMPRTRDARLELERRWRSLL